MPRPVKAYKKRGEWIPASDPPERVESVLMRGGKYWACQGIYSPEKLTHSPAGFYLRSGSDLIYCDWVEWWIPMPNNPK